MNKLNNLDCLAKNYKLKENLYKFRRDEICLTLQNKLFNITLEVRSDDSMETFVNRFDTYLIQTKPLIEYYRKRGILIELQIKENDSAKDVFEKIKSIIG